MKTNESKAGIAVRGILGILASVALTAGAALGVAAELQRGFRPVFEAAADRQPSLRSPSEEARAAPRHFATGQVARAGGPMSHGG
jgi:hypothetical protein